MSQSINILEKIEKAQQELKDNNNLTTEDIWYLNHNIATNYYNLGNQYIIEKNINKTLKNFTIAKQKFYNIKCHCTVACVLLNTAILLIENNNYNEARNNLLEVLLIYNSLPYNSWKKKIYFRWHCTNILLDDYILNPKIMYLKNDLKNNYYH
jgi:tetratricopeptide (TPR) repeat protein